MRKNEQSGQTVGVISLGCSKNLVDTEHMLGLLCAGGFRIETDPARAHILIVNTCGFIEPAKQESIDAILELAAYKQTGSCHTLVVTGCLAQRYRTALMQELPEVDLFLGVREYDQLVPFLTGRSTPRSCTPVRRVLSTPPYRAYLRIADGCNNRCTYCAIPLIRGGLQSEPMDRLLEEARQLVEGGVTELTLIAQDTSGYGKDRYGAPRLIALMEQLTKLDRLKWLRVLYTYPDTVTPELIAAIAGNPKLCNYLDMPLQHSEDAILQAMNRRGSRAHIERVLDYIRTNAPDFILRTTMMVGFPGETERQFASLLSFLEQYPFDRVGAFVFSPEEDTAAAGMPRQVPEAEKAARLDALMRHQQPISMRRNQARIGTLVPVLVEGRRAEGGYTGRSYGEAPDVDGRILFASAARHSPGAYVNVRIKDALEYDLIGEES